ncbi:MAG: Crp/Fnr family transcriptional regulator [Alphaproteobacteria bacterium]|nr:Crp/Fnr family transcriptional regulator [Alphaproteobacteria bacterium]
MSASLEVRGQCALHGSVHRARYSAHETLVREGESRTHFFVLRSGYVKLTTLLATGRAQITALRQPGQLVGFAWEDVVYPYTATALTDVDVCQIAHKAVLQVLQEKSSVALRIVRRVAEELAQARALIRDLGGKNAHERIASFILSFCPAEVEPSETLPFPLTRQEIAELLGLTRETVSRVISELTSEHLIETSHSGVRILAPARLHAVAMGAQ